MKRLYLFIAVLFFACSLHAEDIFKKHGFEKETLTLSKGKYEETFTNDEVVQIGSILLNTKTNKMVRFLDENTETTPFKAEHSSRFMTVDPLAEKYYNISPYAYCMNNPVKFTDPTGAYPVITITKEKTGGTADQRVLGYSGGVTTQVDLYKATITDTEDTGFNMTFSVTRDAWTVEPGASAASNVGFEPKDGDINHFTGNVMSNGYPQGNGTEALKLTQYGGEVVHAESNTASVTMGYRDKADVASGIMIHVGGNYDKGGKNQVAASEGCFGIVNPGNSSSNPSNKESNNILNAIINQANKSSSNPGHIRIIIEKREGHEYPVNKTIP